MSCVALERLEHDLTWLQVAQILKQNVVQGRQLDDDPDRYSTFCFRVPIELRWLRDES